MKHLLAVFIVLGLVTVSASAQEPQFTLRDGSVQIGSAPGRVDMVHPTVRTVTAGTRVQFAFTVTTLDGADPCAGQQCRATVGLRSYGRHQRPYDRVFSVYTLPADITGAMTLDLPSSASASTMPVGRCDLFVSIARGDEVLFEHRVPVVVQ